MIVKNSLNILVQTFLIGIILIQSGCLEEPANPEYSYQFEDSALLLHYLEEEGDYINSGESPSLINASEVYQNLNNYLVIDVSSTEDFINGHISGAINIDPKNLFSFLDSTNVDSYEKIVLISQTGQSAGYYTCLLRLAGIQNVYSMNFGMAAWNSFFSNVWLDHSKVFTQINTFTNNDFEKNDITNLPQSHLDNTSGSLKEKIKKRIQELIDEGFTDYADDFNSQTIASITIGEVYRNYDIQSEFSNQFYIICYGIPALYYTGPPLSGDPLFGYGHPPGAKIYLPNQAFKSVNYLQTLTTDKPIIIYSYSGQNSAYLTAYLRLLGYDARSLLFGANNLIYARMIWNSELNKFAFQQSVINEYPYSIGSE